MKIKRNQRRYRPLKERFGIISTLLALGLPRKMLYPANRSPNQINGPFWDRNIDYLAILELAKRLYREQIVKVHPDRGGDTEQAQCLNRTWQRIKRTFKGHGHELYE